MTEQAAEQMIPAVATLLVVEDDPDIQSALQQIFAMEGYSVLCAASGAATLETLWREAVDLIVLDVNLPDMNGFEICAKIRETALARTPIIMLTARTKQADVTTGLGLGADDYLRKPFEPEELMLRVRHLLDRQNEARSIENEASHLREMLDIVQRQLAVSQNATAIEATLRREFLHNVTTHMRALSGIAEAAVRKVGAGPTRDVVQQLKSRIQGASLVYEISEALQNDPVEVGHVIRTISSALKAMYRPWKRVIVELDGSSVTLPLNIASPLSMIVNELITNAFKHAFPDNRFGKLDIRYGIAGDVFVLDVEDNGVGFDVGAGMHGKGSTTITYLAQQLHGQATWQSSATGTHARITIPVNEPSELPAAT